jgi:glutathione synthase/RimK-type ligase-like ATP-grasp enzyme
MAISNIRDGAELTDNGSTDKAHPSIAGMVRGKDTRDTTVTKRVPEFLHNSLEGLKEITLSDQGRYKEALEKSPQRMWLNYFPFLLLSNFNPTRSILLGEECGSLCIYILLHWPRKNRLHLYFPPMPMNQEALDRCFSRINTFNGDYSGRLWWVSEALKNEIDLTDNFLLKLGDEEFIYDHDMFQNLNGSNFSKLRYQLRRAERKHPIEARRFSPQDKNKCLELLEKWYQAKTDNNEKAINYFYAKACIQLFEQFSPNVLTGFVYTIAERIVAFAFGGELVRGTGCSFVRISDHDYNSIGYFVCHHLITNMQQCTTVNDGGTADISGLKSLKNTMVPTRIDAIYRARQKRLYELVTSGQETKSDEREVLKGLKSFTADDQEIFLRCIGQAKMKSWASCFPVLYSFSQCMRGNLYWELYRGSICLYYLLERPSGKKLSLYFPPFPFRSRTLSYAMDRVNRFNQNENGEITWIEESDRQDIIHLGYAVTRIKEEHIYSKESLDAIFTIYPLDDNITTRPYTHKDQETCLELLKRWRTGYQEKGGKNSGYDLKRSCIQNASSYMDGTIIGEVLLVGKEIQGVCFAGAINADLVNFLITITAPQYNHLKLFQQASLSRHFPASLYNNSVEIDEASGPYLSAMTKPTAIYPIFRARKIKGKDARMFIREVKDINTALFIKAARELNLEVDVVSTSYSYGVISNGKKVLHVYHNSTSITDVATRRVTHNKYLSQNILKAHGIPAPNAKIFSSTDADKILDYAEKHRPVVIKPVKGSRSVGVTVNPQNADEIRQAVSAIQNDNVMVEQFIHGNSYRILIYNDKIVDVLRWLPPYVTGNGLDSLFDLVEVKNEYYRRNNLYSIHIDFDYLADQGVDMGFVPEKGRNVSLHPSHEHYVGGEPVRVNLATIHPDNREMFVKVAKVSGLALAGLDFISDDLGIAYANNGAGVNEINSNPEMWPHFFCEQQEDISAIKTILAEYFSITAS